MRTRSKPLHGLTPRTILGQEWWDETRRAAYASTDWHCVACGVHKRDAKERPFLEGHELYRIDYVKGRAWYVETVPLCHWCHYFIHDGRLSILVETGEVSRRKFEDVIAHGRRVLREAGLVKTPYSGPIAEWSKWRLVLNRRLYKPLWKDYQDWLARCYKVAEDAG